MYKRTVAVLMLTLILGLMACGRGVPADAQLAAPATSAPTPTPTVMPSSDAQQVSKANQEYLKGIGVTTLLTPEEKNAATGITTDMSVFTDCYMEQAGQSLTRPRGGVFASLPYIAEAYSSPPGATIPADQWLDYQRNFLNRDTLGPLIQGCITVAYAHYGEMQQAQEYELLEAGKAGAMVFQIGLLSPDMAHNCHEWASTNATNYLTLRAGSVKRRGAAAGLRFDHAWGKAKDTINAACAF